MGETVLAGLPAPRRTRLSLRVADALEGRHAAADGDARAGEVARHLRAAGPLAAPERRARWERAAGAEATAALAHEQAADHYEAALAALGEAGAGFDGGGGRSGGTLGETEAGLDDGGGRSRLLLELAGAHERAGHRRRAREAFAAVAAVARERRDPALLARAALGHGGLGVSIAAADPQVVALLDEALDGLDAADRATRARLRARLAVELYYSSRDRARDLSAAAVDDARATGDAATLAAALNARRVVIWDPLHSEERLAVATEMVALGEAAGDPTAALQGHNWRVVDLLELGRVGEAAAEVDVYAERADAIGLPHYRWFVPLWRACLALLTGRWEEAQAQGARARALGAAADDPNAALLVRIQDEYEREARRRVEELDRDWVVEMAASTPAPGAWEVWLAEIDVMRGDAAAGRRLVEDLTRDGCRRLPVDVNWHALCDLTEAIAELGERDAAHAVYEKLAPHAHLFPVVARAVACYGSAEYYVGRLAATLGWWDEAEARLRRAVDEDERVGAAPRAALAVLRLGELRAARGDVEGGRDLLAEAAGRARALHVPALAAEAEDVLGTLVGAA